MNLNNQNASLKPTDEPMIPKHRFDEVNFLYKTTKEKNDVLEEEIKKQEAQIEVLCRQIEQIKAGYEKAANILRVKEIFVSGGLTESEYQDVISIISRVREEDMCELANSITNLIKLKQGE